MKGLRILILATAAGCPAWAIEPPVPARPIPPSEPRAAEPAQAEQPEVPPVARPVDPAEDADARPYIGVILDPVPELLASHLRLAPGEGVVVGETIPGGPAEAAGLKVNDIIVSVDGRAVGTAEDVRAAIEGRAVGDELPIEVVQAGERRELGVTLGAAPQTMPGGAALEQGFGQGPPGDLEGMLGQLPDRHAELLRRAMERNMRAFEDIEREAGQNGHLQRDLLRRMERGFRGLQGDVESNIESESTIRLLDEQGSIEMKTRSGKKEARIFDEAGELLWEGPYDTPQDRAAVPDDLKPRLERMNLDFDFKGGGMKFRFGPERFRGLDEMDER